MYYARQILQSTKPAVQNKTEFFVTGISQTSMNKHLQSERKEKNPILTNKFPT